MAQGAQQPAQRESVAASVFSAALFPVAVVVVADESTLTKRIQGKMARPAAAEQGQIQQRQAFQRLQGKGLMGAWGLAAVLPGMVAEEEGQAKLVRLQPE